MSEKKTDRRIRYTKMVIRQALFELLKDCPINKITVTEICDLAEINRGTFYAYYSDPYDLMTQIENEVYSEINHFLSKPLVVGTNFDLLVELFEYISQNKDLCKILFSANGDKEFISRIVNIGHEKCIKEWQSIIPKATVEELQSLYIFISSGIVGVVQNWIVNDTGQSITEVAEFIKKLIKQCLQISD